MRNLTIIGGATAIVLAVAGFQSGKPHSYIPPEGFVSDSSTATRIAEAVWLPIYGEPVISGERPYHARLEHGVWIVLGSMHGGGPGGVARAEIAKRDGRVLRVTHGK